MYIAEPCTLLECCVFSVSNDCVVLPLINVNKIFVITFSVDN